MFYYQEIFSGDSEYDGGTVLPGATEVLLGAIPLEDIDVLIDPKSQQLIVHPARPYVAGTKCK